MSESEFPRKTSRQKSTTYGYSVEARMDENAEPKNIDGFTLSHKWQRIPQITNSQGIGVPNPRFSHELSIANLLGYQQAQALRWWFLASLEATGFFRVLNVETRIVSHEINLEYTVTALGEHGWIHGEDRSNFLPDWNTANQPDQLAKAYRIAASKSADTENKS